MLANPRAVIGGNNPPTLTEEINGRHADLLDAIHEIVATDLPLVVTSEIVAAQVAHVGKAATGLARDVDAVHKTEKQPHLDAGREVDAWKTATLAPLTTLLNECKALVSAWQDRKEQEERAAREAAARQLAIAREAAEQKAMKTMAPKDMERAADIAEAAAVAETAAAATAADLSRVVVAGKAVASRSENWTYRVVNAAEIPRQYLMPNDAAIKAAIKGKNGLREIPGLEIYPDKRTTFR